MFVVYRRWRRISSTTCFSRSWRPTDTMGYSLPSREPAPCRSRSASTSMAVRSSSGWPSESQAECSRMVSSFELYLVLCNHCSYHDKIEREKERNVLFNDALNTFYLRLYGVRHMVKDHSDSEKGNPLPPHRLLLSINSKGSFICTIPQTG